MELADFSPQLSTDLAALFPPGVVVAATSAPGERGALLPDEAAGLSVGAVAKRVHEFAAGRLCARRALAEFGIVDFPVRVGAKREPLWPDGYVGSITHTDGLYAAVVGERGRFFGLGLDVEQTGRVSASLQARICVAGEIDWLAGLHSAEASVAATLIFAAKEAFYKAQFPVVREWLYFEDAAIELPDWPAPTGSWLLRPQRAMAIDRVSEFPLRGAYRLAGGFVIAGVAIEPRAATDLPGFQNLR
jgi:4'-phosphopantetheinyl transferase EntD